MSSTRFITVITRHPESVPAYLYSHTVITGEGTNDYGSTGMVLQTTADTDDRAEYLANYQAGRLDSGLHSARVYTSVADAVLALSDLFGVTVFNQCSAGRGGDPASGCDNEAESGTDTCVEHRLAYEALCDPDLEPTLDGYEVEFVDVITVSAGPMERFGVGLDSLGNVVRFRKAEDASLDTIVEALRHGSDITVQVASCEVISRKPAFETV